MLRLAGLAGALLLAASSNVALLDSGPVVDAVQKRYDAVKDLRARFVQTSHVVSVGRKETTSGTIQVLRPGYMRWEYDKPEGRLIVMDRETLRIYDPEERQLQIAALNSNSVSPTALTFLLGKGVLRDIFTADLLPRSERGELGLKLWPRNESSFESLELWLDPATHQLRESVVVDLFGNRTQVRFDSVTENVGVGEGDFSIKVPDDTEVIDLR